VHASWFDYKVWVSQKSKNQKFCERNVIKDQTKTIQKKSNGGGLLFIKTINLLGMLRIERVKNKEGNIFMARNQNSIINYINNLPSMKF
jgi:hypothetical protein